jgi:hypothetical protein
MEFMCVSDLSSCRPIYNSVDITMSTELLYLTPVDIFTIMWYFLNSIFCVANICNIAGNNFLIQRAAANMLSELPRTADEGWYSSFGDLVGN